jgi:hypothetical protein
MGCGTTYATPRSRTTRPQANPAVYVQARAGHAQATMTERYLHAEQVAFPGTAEKADDRLFSAISSSDPG